MILKYVLEVYELLDQKDVTGECIKQYLNQLGPADIEVQSIETSNNKVDFIRITISGKNGKINGGNAKTLGILGRLGGIGARPRRIGFVSDGDGALSVLAVASKLIAMKARGDILNGDVVISTQICPNAPTKSHKPVDFMGSAIEIHKSNEIEIRGEADAIISVDTTKGNRIINYRGIAISPTVKEGYILKTSEDLLDLLEMTTGKTPRVFALSQLDITPYENNLYHLNSILQPATSTNAPVVGLAITTETVVAGCATGASHFDDIEESGRFIIEVAKEYGNANVAFYDESEFDEIVRRYGSMKKFQTIGIDA